MNKIDFYKKNLDAFIEDILEVKLGLWQKIIIRNIDKIKYNKGRNIR